MLNIYLYMMRRRRALTVSVNDEEAGRRIKRARRASAAPSIYCRYVYVSKTFIYTYINTRVSVHMHIHIFGQIVLGVSPRNDRTKKVLDTTKQLSCHRSRF